MDLEINKGIGRNVEFKGLESQYLFIFCGGLLAVFVVFVILYMAGVSQWVCIGFGVAALPAERPVRHARADEGSRPQAASEVRGEPAENPPIIHL